LITDILDFSKIEAGKMKIEPEPIQLEKLLHEINSLFETQAHEKGLDFKVREFSTNDLILLLDPNRLKQILINLLGNAIKFTPKGSVVLETIYRSDPNEPGSVSLEFKVVDTGIGIADGQKTIIFDAFEQQSGQNETYGGTGLGLAISRKLAQAMGGVVTVSDNDPKGSIFTLVLDQVPIAPGFHPGELSEFAETLHQVVFKPAKIMIVDDVDLNLQLLKSQLQEYPFEISLAQDGRKAVKLAKMIQPDVILMDYKMPFMNGLEAAEEIKKLEISQSTKIIMLSAAVQEEDRKLFLSVCDSFLSKPITKNLLIEELSKYLTWTHLPNQP